MRNLTQREWAEPRPGTELPPRPGAFCTPYRAKSKQHLSRDALPAHLGPDTARDPTSHSSPARSRGFPRAPPPSQCCPFITVHVNPQTLQRLQLASELLHKKRWRFSHVHHPLANTHTHTYNTPLYHTRTLASIHQGLETPPTEFSRKHLLQPDSPAVSHGERGEHP